MNKILTANNVRGTHTHRLWRYVQWENEKKVLVVVRLKLRWLHMDFISIFIKGLLSSYGHQRPTTNHYCFYGHSKLPTIKHTCDSKAFYIFSFCSGISEVEVYRKMHGTWTISRYNIYFQNTIRISVLLILRFDMISLNENFVGKKWKFEILRKFLRLGMDDKLENDRENQRRKERREITLLVACFSPRVWLTCRRDLFFHCRWMYFGSNVYINVT